MVLSTKTIIDIDNDLPTYVIFEYIDLIYWNI